jgi:hypothetical protein
MEESQDVIPVAFIDSVTKYNPESYMHKNRKITLVLKNHVL